MMEARLFEEGTIPPESTAEWYLGRETAPHVDQWVHQSRINLAVHMVKRIAMSWGYQTVVDLGAGDGGPLSLLRNEPLTSWGYDLMPTNVEAARGRQVDVRYGNIIEDDLVWGQIAMCTECIEHLLDPHAFVQKIRANARALVASSPFTETAESHDAVHLWAWDQDGYRTMLEDAGWSIIDHQTTGMFQVIAAVAEL